MLAICRTQNPEEIDQEDVEVWPDAWPAFRLFNAMGTQWCVGPGGPSGLDYAVIPSTALMLGIKCRDLTDIFPDLLGLGQVTVSACCLNGISIVSVRGIRLAQISPASTDAVAVARSCWLSA